MRDIEGKLIKKCIKGDIDAFEKLIANYEKKAYNIALKILKNREDAMDVTQEAFIKVFKSIKNFKGDSSFSTWLYRIVTNASMDFLRKNSKVVYSIDNPIETENGNISRQIEDKKNNTEELVDKKLTKEMVHSAIDKLEDNFKTVIILRDIEGFSYDEMAKILDCNLGTVKSRLSRARKKLKYILYDNMEQNDESFV